MGSVLKEKNMRTKKLLTAAAAAVFLATAPAHADMSVEHYLKWKDNAAVSERLNEYLYGVGRGMVVANAIHHQYHVPVLFCPPERMPLDGSNFTNMIDRFIKEKHVAEKTPDIGVEYVLFLALMETFPCPTEKQ